MVGELDLCETCNVEMHVQDSFCGTTIIAVQQTRSNKRGEESGEQVHFHNPLHGQNNIVGVLQFIITKRSVNSLTLAPIWFPHWPA